MLWLTSGALALALAMVVGLLLLVVVQGARTFWPVGVALIRTHDGRTLMGEITRRDEYRPEQLPVESLPAGAAGQARAFLEKSGGHSERFLIRTGNYELTNEHFTWVSDFEIVSSEPIEWALVLERTEWGRFYGVPVEFRIDGKTVATGASAAWQAFGEHHGAVLERRSQRQRLERHDLGLINRRIERARLAVREAELRYGADSPQVAEAASRQALISAEVEGEFASTRARIEAIDAENARYELVLATAEHLGAGAGASEAPAADPPASPPAHHALPLDTIVRAYPANQLAFAEKMGIYLSRWWEFLADEPREANTEGGVVPAIFGTVAMTLLMSIAVVPFGVLTALYLREYARTGPIISAVRIAVNNLAGVPSIVFGVFGLGFFSYIIGGSIDSIFFAEQLPSPTFGTGGILWASLTLALLTLPVVIVATEEALAAVPNSMREGSYACGAGKWQTIRRIVLPRALPGLMTGTILAMARGAGEVAPLMLVGAVKLAPELPVDGEFPFVHPQRSFMHLGFHIYDLGFQSPNSEAARPMVFTTTLLLIAIIAALNVTAVYLRARLRRRFAGGQF